MTKRRAQGWVFLKIDMPADLYERLQAACEYATGKPRKVSWLIRRIVEAFVLECEAEQRGEPPLEDYPG